MSSVAKKKKLCTILKEPGTCCMTADEKRSRKQVLVIVSVDFSRFFKATLALRCASVMNRGRYRGRTTKMTSNGVIRNENGPSNLYDISCKVSSHIFHHSFLCRLVVFFVLCRTCSKRDREHFNCRLRV